MEDKEVNVNKLDFGGFADTTWRDLMLKRFEEDYGYVPNYPRPSESYDRNPFNLIEGNENKLY